jgi:hypothetical protein
MLLCGQFCNLWKVNGKKNILNGQLNAVCSDFVFIRFHYTGIHCLLGFTIQVYTVY